MLSLLSFPRIVVHSQVGWAGIFGYFVFSFFFALRWTINFIPFFTLHNFVVSPSHLYVFFFLFSSLSGFGGETGDSLAFWQLLFFALDFLQVNNSLFFFQLEHRVRIYPSSSSSNSRITGSSYSDHLPKEGRIRYWYSTYPQLWFKRMNKYCYDPYPSPFIAWWVVYAYEAKARVNALVRSEERRVGKECVP